MSVPSIIRIPAEIILRALAPLFPPHIEDSEATINHIMEKHCSVSRYGDGEFELMRKATRKIGFQKGSAELMQRLWDVMNSLPYDARHIVCIPSHLYDHQNINKDSIKMWNRQLPYFAACIQRRMKYPRRRFFDSLCTRLYMSEVDKSRVGILYDKWKQVWSDQDVLLVEGASSRLGVGNDLLDGAKSIRRILIPSVDAFARYDDIMALVRAHYQPGQLVLLAAGPTATVLAYDLAQENVWAIDIGHIDIEYCWFLMNATEKVPVPGKWVNEAGGYTDGQPEGLRAYESQIVARID